MRVAISFDYDSPAGYRQSFSKKHCDPRADYDGTEALLKVLDAHRVKATFAIVGCVALDGEIPERCPDQIRRIAAAKHEVASHSMYHKFIPAMKDQELFDDAKASKEALEACIGTSVRGFIPPFNRPVHFPRKFAFSASERLGLQGRGRGRQSLADLLETLSITGFGWCRVSFQNTLWALAQKVGAEGNGVEGRQPFLYSRMVVVPLHATGFTENAIKLVRSHLDSDALIVLYSHPNQALADPRKDSEAAENLDRFLTLFKVEREVGKLKFQTMAQVESTTRSLAPVA
jgi:peptidoglycan/xylan/chitin deacetylase (PgdA/CDA1 family)